MRYLTGVHALNIPCNLNTTGDWHSSALQWEKLNIKESDDTLLKDYGIEEEKKIPTYSETFYVANHIRALLDMLIDGDFSNAQGMRKDYICNDKYNNEIFSKVMSFENLSNWNDIDKFMSDEYRLKWLNYKRGYYG